MSALSELKNTTKLVKAILEADARARNSDDYLYWKVVKQIQKQTVPAAPSLMFDTFMLHRAELGFPGFETVRRTRQKIQAECADLRATAQVEGYRSENETDFKTYALGADADG